MRPFKNRDGTRPSTTSDLLPSERRFVAALQELNYGRLESIQIKNGELLLDPWPATVREVKFAALRAPNGKSAGFELKQQVAEFFEYVRSVGSGEIRVLQVHDGLPFSLEIEVGHRPNGGSADA